MPFPYVPSPSHLASRSLPNKIDSPLRLTISYTMDVAGCLVRQPLPGQPLSNRKVTNKFLIPWL